MGAKKLSIEVLIGRCAFLIIILAFLCGFSPAQVELASLPKDLTDLSLEQLVEIPIYGASRYEQKEADVPASVSIVTKEEIKKYGSRTLAEILQSAPGFFLNFDRNYASLGLRGFSILGDYNTRVLILLDCHRLNDPVYNQGPIGTDFPVDVDLFERVDGVRVRLVVTHRDNPAETIWFGSVERQAREAGLEVALPEDPNDPSFAGRLARIAPDFLFSFYYRQMLSPAVLAAARRGAFNMHGSLLPKYRGRVPVNWAVLRGERETGATLHEMVAKPDAGRIVDQEAVPIGENDTAAEVFGRVTGAAVRVLERSLPPLLDGTARLRPQDLGAGSYFGGRRPEDGRIDWTRAAREVHDLERAVAPPYPGAFTEVNRKRFFIWQAKQLGRGQGRPGENNVLMLAASGTGGMEGSVF